MPAGLWRRAGRRWLRLVERLTGANGRDVLPLTLHRRRIYVLPTGFGVALALLIFVMLMGSLNFNNNMGLAFTFLLGGLGLIAPLLTFLNLYRIEVVDATGHSVHAGEPCAVTLRLRGRRASGHWSIRVQYGAAYGMTHAEPHGQTSVTIRVPTERRGPLRLARLKISTVYPLGIFRAWAVLSPAQATLIYPAPEPNAPPLPKGRTDRRSGAAANGSEQFYGVREYQPQDSPRLIAWKTVARTGELHTKQFEDPGAGRVELCESDLLGLGLEQRVSRLTAWVLTAHARDMAWSFQLGSTRLPTASGDSHRRRCLELLATHE